MGIAAEAEVVVIWILEEDCNLDQLTRNGRTCLLLEKVPSIQ